MRLTRNSSLSPFDIIFGLLFSLVILALAYGTFGGWTTMIFSFGFIGGYVLWLVFPSETPYARIKAPYLLTLALFILFHRVEENIFKFQEELAKITQNEVPEISSPALIALVLLSVGGWLMVPFLFRRKSHLGYYFAWSFFASMGITELAHFIFPLLTDKTYGYFPGMASVVFLAPSAWWGFIRLVQAPMASRRPV